jgi:hypothetical protein
LADEVEVYLVASHHRPLLERQRRAKAEYDAVSMKMDPSMDYATFQAEFRKCCNNLQRARLQKGIEDLKVDFLEKVPEECARYLMLTPYRDSVTGLMRPPATAEEVQAMAREYFAVQDSSRAVHPGGGVRLWQGQGQGRQGQGQGAGLRWLARRALELQVLRRRGTPSGPVPGLARQRHVRHLRRPWPLRT